MKLFLKLIALPLLFLGMILLTGCSPNSNADENVHADEMVLPQVTALDLGTGQKLAVVATTSMIGDVADAIGGQNIDLAVLIGIGQNPHSFEPTPQDLAAVEDADVLFVNGLDLEEVLMEAIYETSRGVVVPVSAGIEVLALGGDMEEDDDGHLTGDPHFWVDPNNVIVWAENIAAVLSAIDPVNETDYQTNASAYIAELQVLDSYIREQTAAIPESERKIVTDHHSLGYFADEYGYMIIGTVIPSTTDSGGASAGEVAELASLMVSENVETIFIGQTASQGMRSLAEALADEIGGEVRIVELLTGSLAPAGEPGDTYIGYMQYNIDQIVSGLLD